MTFAAAHRYRRPDWSDDRNAETFGLCARPNYHGHSYRCDVTVQAESIDAETGFVVDLGLLDRVLHDEVRARFDHANINLDVPEFADGALIPTGENLARFICERVQRRLEDALGSRAPRVAARHRRRGRHTLSATYEP